MPVEFLTRQQRQRLGRFNQDPTPEQLAGCFHLDDADRTLINRRTRDRVRLGFAVQLGTLRYLGTILPDPTEVPTVVVDYLARQLGISDPSVLKGYGEGETRWDHASEIRRIYGYSDFFDEPGHAELRQWVEARAWTMGERPGVLFDLTTAWLLQRKVVLPGATVLERFIASIHEGATNRLWVTLAAAPTPQVLQLLEELLVVPEGSRRSSFDRLRQAPRAPTAAGMVSALRRLEEVRALGLGTIDFSGVPRGRIELLARAAATSKAQALSRMGNEARLAHLVAFMSLLEVAAVDDLLAEVDVVVGELLGKVERKAQRERLRSLGDLDAAALSLSEAFRALRHAAASPKVDLRRFFLEQLPHARLVAAAEAVASLVTTPEDNSQRALVTRYGYVRRFLPLLLQAVGFDANDAGQPVLKALGFLRGVESERPRASFKKEAPTGIVTGSWRRAILVEGGIDHRAYTLCTIQRLREGLRRRDVFVPGSGRWADPRAAVGHRVGSHPG